MGESSTGILTYGYYLGGNDDGWKIKNLGEYGDWIPFWIDKSEIGDPDDDDYEGSGIDIVTECEKRLLAVLADFTETDWRVEGYHQREREAKARMGVEIESCSHHEYPGYFLSAGGESVGDYGVMAVDLLDLINRKIKEGWDERLRRACEALGIEPEQEEPQWFLGSRVS